MKKITGFLLLASATFASGFDDGVSIGEKVKIKHMATTHQSGVVGDTLYVYEADKRETVKDKEGDLHTNSVHTDARTLRKNRKLNVSQTQENTTVRRVSGLTKNRKILKSQSEKRTKGIEIGKVDLRNTKIKNVKTYRRNNHYRIEK